MSGQLAAFLVIGWLLAVTVGQIAVDVWADRRKS